VKNFCNNNPTIINTIPTTVEVNITSLRNIWIINNDINGVINTKLVTFATFEVILKAVRGVRVEA